MSYLHIEIKKTFVVNGEKYKADINKDVHIDFSAAQYTVKINEDNENDIELVPDNIDFLKELTKLFPLSDYEIKIVQKVYEGSKPHVSLYVDLYHRETGKKVYNAENATLSDDDYDYIRTILMKEVPGVELQTKEDYIKSGIMSCLGDECNDELFTRDSRQLLGQLVAESYMDIKTKGYVDFECNGMDVIAKQVIENALRGLYEIQTEASV